MRWKLCLTKPRLQIKWRTDFRFGQPQVMYGSAMRSILMVALFSLMNTPLFICRRRNNCSTLRTLGATLLILKCRTNSSTLRKVTTRNKETPRELSPTPQPARLPANPDYKSQLRFSGHVVHSTCFGQALHPHLVPLRPNVLILVLFCTQQILLLPGGDDSRPLQPSLDKQCPRAQHLLGEFLLRFGHDGKLLGSFRVLCGHHLQ